jgi:hypothetical protein
MPLKSSQDSSRRMPAGFTQRSGGLASEHARELGWGINENERTHTPEGRQDADGGRDYNYGARDFGDTAVNTSAAQPSRTVARGPEVPRISTSGKAVHKAAPRKSH